MDEVLQLEMDNSVSGFEGLKKVNVSQEGKGKAC